MRNSNWLKLTLTLASSFFVASANAAEGATAYIVNGSDTTAASYPSYARLVMADWGYLGYYSKYCGAVILNADYILTAAHCVYIDSTSTEDRVLFTYVYPQLGDESYSNLLSSSKLRVSDVYIHGDYNDSLIENDIAVLKLATSITSWISGESSDKAVLPSDGTSYRSATETFTAVGHGDDSVSGTTSSDTTTTLQQVELEYVANASCGYGGVPDTNLCMKGDDSSSSNVIDFASLDPSTCSGDSGGPLYWDDSGNSNTQTLVGITSFGPGTYCGDTSYSSTSVFSEVHDFKEDWIDKVTTATEESLGSITYTLYSFSESDRESYRSGSYNYKYSTDTSTDTSTASSSGSSGGVIPLWSLLLLVSGIVLRRKQK